MSQGPIDNSYWLPGGQVCAGEYPGGRLASEVRRKLSALLDAGIRSFVDLTQPVDGLRPYVHDLKQLAVERRIEVLHEPLSIRDMDIPPRPHMQRILEHLDAEVAAGRKVYVHCWGGVGRTGTVVGCHLVRGGKSGNEALAEIARLWTYMSEQKQRDHPESPQTEPQRRFVREWGSSHDAA